MTEWAMRRFWTAVSVVADRDGYHVRLDDRPVRTPGKTLLVVPTEVMAQELAAEWDAQEETVNPLTMPWTRSSNSALDKVATQRADVEAHLAGYAGTDLLCYRADGPEALAERQRIAWDPLVDWAAEEFGARLAITAGVMPVSQDASALDRLSSRMAHMSDFQLTGFHDLVALSGSFILALAVTESRTDAEAAWTASRIDEDWQIEQWGDDEEAANHAELKKKAFVHAAKFYHAA